MTKAELKMAEKMAAMEAEKAMIERHSRIAKEYAESHPEPDQAYCPIIVQKVRKSKGFYYHNSLSGVMEVRSNNYGAVPQLLLNSYSVTTQEEYDAIKPYNYNIKTPTYNYIGQYVKNIQALGMIEISYVICDGRRGVENVPRTWKYPEYMSKSANASYFSSNIRLFMFKGDKNLYGYDGELLFKHANGKYSNKDFPKFCNCMYKTAINCLSSGEEFTKFADPSFLKFRLVGTNVWAGDYDRELRNSYLFGRWYTKIFKTTTDPVKKEKVKNLFEIPLAPVEELKEKYKFKYKQASADTLCNPTYEIEARRYIHFEKVNEEYCVLRQLDYSTQYLYYSSSDFEKEGGYFTEKRRFYIDQKGRIITANILGDTVHCANVSSVSLNGYYDRYGVQFGNLEEIKNWKRLSYIYDILKDNPDNNVLATLVDLLRHPIAERVYKAGYKGIYKTLCSEGTIAAKLLAIFDVKEKSKTSLKDLGSKTLLTAYNTIMTERYDRYNMCEPIIKWAKILTNNEIDNWDLNSCTELLNGITSAILSNHYRTNSLLVLMNPKAVVRYRYYCDEIVNENLTEDQRNHYVTILRRGANDPQYLNSYFDLCSQYRQLSDEKRREINIDDLYCDLSIDNIMRYHDAAVELYTQQCRERRALQDLEEQKRLIKEKEIFGKLQKKRREKFNYHPENSEYLIKVPEDPAEISIEGPSLAHCVAGYKEQHMRGDTNIIFLRKVSAPNVPFFTIEVMNDEVTQIHGSHNRWLGTEPDAIPFVVEWIRAKGIKCEGYKVLCKSMGYSSTREYADGSKWNVSPNSMV